MKVGVAYNADPDQVLEILRSCANAHPEVLNTPAPNAIMEGFGEHALLFSLRVSVPDEGRAFLVQSDLRIAILKALRAANIEIPYHQVDVNLRDLDSVKKYLARLTEESAAPKTETGPAPSGNGQRLTGETS